jgi:hypothetical protein
MGELELVGPADLMFATSARVFTHALDGIGSVLGLREPFAIEAGLKPLSRFTCVSDARKLAIAPL